MRKLKGDTTDEALQAGVSQPEGKIPTIPVRAERTIIHLLLMAVVSLHPAMGQSAG